MSRMVPPWHSERIWITQLNNMQTIEICKKLMALEKIKLNIV